MFTTVVELGTPAQSFELIVDTGSSLLWVACGGCGTSCESAQGLATGQGGFFNTEASSTFKAVSCTGLDCVTSMCESELPLHTAGLNFSAASDVSGGGLCAYVCQYADGSVSSGAIVNDVVRLGSIADALLFGCEIGAGGNVQQDSLDGIIGLGLGDQSVITQLTQAQVIGDSFAVCLGPVGSSYVYDWQGNGRGSGGGEASSVVGALFLGDVATELVEYAVWTPLVRSLACWENYIVTVDGMSVVPPRHSGEAVNIAQYSPYSDAQMGFLYGSGCGGVILDSGSSMTYVPGPALEALHYAVGANLAPGAREMPCPAAAQSINSTCYQAPPGGDVDDYFPGVLINFAAGAQLYVPPTGYLFSLGIPWPGVYVLGWFNSGGYGTILGAITLADNLVVFDRQENRVMFRNGTDCTKLGQQSSAGVPASVPPSPWTAHHGIRYNPLPVGSRVVIPPWAVLLLILGALAGLALGQCTLCVQDNCCGGRYD